MSLTISAHSSVSPLHSLPSAWEGVSPADEGSGLSQALVVLTPPESKRLIARAVAGLPEVQWALKNGRLGIAGGTTNAFIVEELLGEKFEKSRYTVGIVTDGVLKSTPSEGRVSPRLLDHGRPAGVGLRDFLQEFGPRDVYIKGANAVDPQGHAGVLSSDVNGGTVGAIWGRLVASGAHLIVPVGLEKLVPSVLAAARLCHQGWYSRVMGDPCALFPLVNATVITEIQAFRLLAGVEATHVASGGVGGSEGAVVLSLRGPVEAVEKAFQLAQSVKGEPAVPGPAAWAAQP